MIRYYEQLGDQVSSYWLIVGSLTCAIIIALLLYDLWQNYVDNGRWFGNSRISAHQDINIHIGIPIVVFVVFSALTCIVGQLIWIVPSVSVAAYYYFGVDTFTNIELALMVSGAMLPVLFVIIFRATAIRARNEKLTFEKLKG